MTEDTGFPEVPAPAAEDAPAGPAEDAPAQEDAAPAEGVTEAPEPFVPDGQPDWLRAIIGGFHERLVKLGG